MIMGTKKSQDLQSASWRPRRAGGVSSHLRTGRLKTQEEPVCQFWVRCSNQGSQAGAVPFLFYSGLQSIEWGLTTLEKAICFTQSVDSYVHLIQKHPPKQRIIFDQMSKNPMDQSSWHIKLSITLYSIFLGSKKLYKEK